MLPVRADGLLSARAAAELVRVTPRTIDNWRARGLLDRFGLDERGWALYRREDVRAAEMEARRLGMAALGTDPRRLRKPKPRARAA